MEKNKVQSNLGHSKMTGSIHGEMNLTCLIFPFESPHLSNEHTPGEWAQIDICPHGRVQQLQLVEDVHLH